MDAGNHAEPSNHGEDLVRIVPLARTSTSSEAAFLSGVSGSDGVVSSETFNESGVWGVESCCGDRACGEPSDSE